MVRHYRYSEIQQLQQVAYECMIKIETDYVAWCYQLSLSLYPLSLATLHIQSHSIYNINKSTNINQFTYSQLTSLWPIFNHPRRRSVRNPRPLLLPSFPPLPLRLLVLPRDVVACCFALLVPLAVRKLMQLRWGVGLARWLACQAPSPCGVWARRGWPV